HPRGTKTRGDLREPTRDGGQVVEAVPRGPVLDIAVVEALLQPLERVLVVEGAGDVLEPDAHLGELWSACREVLVRHLGAGDADLERLPFRPQSLGGAWARNSYLHLPAQRLPLALADLHRVTAPDAPIFLRVIPGDYEGHALPGDDFPGRFFAFWDPDRLGAVV